MNMFRWPTVIKVAVSAILYIILMYVYMKSLHRNKHVWSQFKLTDKSNIKRDSSHLIAAQSKHVFPVDGLAGYSEKERVHDLENNDLDQGRPSKDGSSRGQAGPGQPEAINVYVVEEHHEVIPYWFGAAENGLIPKQGNTLVHIDGHSDLAPPVYMPGYPLFRWPQTQSELRYFMQRNDAFIQASAMAGLVERSIWVWPSWDKINHDSYYVAANMSFGWFETRKHGDKAFCMCISGGAGSGSVCRTFTEYGSYNSNSTEYGGDTSNSTGDETTTPFTGFPVPPSLCKIMKTMMVEEVSEIKAVALFRKTNWLRDKKTLILDIDEDYFGVSHAIRPLLEANITVEHIMSIDAIVGALFCPSNINHEKRSDDILQDISKDIRKVKTCKRNPTKQPDSCGGVFEISNSISTINRIVQNIQSLRRQNQIRVCTKNTGKLGLILKRLMYHINKMNTKQIKQLQYVGFCSKTSSKSMIADEIRHFGVCSGANTPDNSVVIEHLPSVEEVTTRSRLLTLILAELRPTPPNIVTVCRSVRDGYTPRNMSELIEQNILNILDQTFLTKVTYDSGLIGGKDGWSSTHVKLMQ